MLRLVATNKVNNIRYSCKTPYITAEFDDYGDAAVKYYIDVARSLVIRMYIANRQVLRLRCSRKGQSSTGREWGAPVVDCYPRLHSLQ